jgi:hypothetical protein
VAAPSVVTNGHLPPGKQVEQWVADNGMPESGEALARDLQLQPTTVNYTLRKLRNGKTPATEPAKAPASPKVAAGKPTGKRFKRGWSLRVGNHLTKWVVLAVAALWTYTHVTELALDAGIGWLSYTASIPLDGLVAACVYTIVSDRKRKPKRFGHPLAWIGGFVTAIAAVTANVLAMRPDLVPMSTVGPVMAGFVPIALIVVVALDAHDKADAR